MLTRRIDCTYSDVMNVLDIHCLGLLKVSLFQNNVYPSAVHTCSRRKATSPTFTINWPIASTPYVGMAARPCLPFTLLRHPRFLL